MPLKMPFWQVVTYMPVRVGSIGGVVVKLLACGARGPGLVSGLAATISEIGYLLLPSCDIAERSLKRLLKILKTTTNQSQRELGSPLMTSWKVPFWMGKYLLIWTLLPSVVHTSLTNRAPWDGAGSLNVGLGDFSRFDFATRGIHVSETLLVLKSFLFQYPQLLVVLLLPKY